MALPNCTALHTQVALPFTKTARSMCMAQQESYITDGQDQVLRLEARLIGLSQGILICPLSFAREVAVAQSHNPQECCHSGNSCSQPSGQVEEVCCPSCSTPCTVSSSTTKMTALLDIKYVCWVQTLILALLACPVLSQAEHNAAQCVRLQMHLHILACQLL